MYLYFYKYNIVSIQHLLSIVQLSLQYQTNWSEIMNENEAILLLPEHAEKTQFCQLFLQFVKIAFQKVKFTNCFGFIYNLSIKVL